MRESIRRPSNATSRKGKRNEERFFEAMNDLSAGDMPHWYLGVLRPTTSQDRFEGIDAIVKTADVGELFVQIKSSYTGKKKFLRGRHFAQNKSIIIIVIGEPDTPAEIRTKTRRQLSKLRWQFLDLKSRICNK